MSAPTATHAHPPGPVAELRRCPTCNRWGGKRDLDDDGITVHLHPTEQRGTCNEGPWHGSQRGPRNACGQWLRWTMIAATDFLARSFTWPAPILATVRGLGLGAAVHGR